MTIATPTRSSRPIGIMEGARNRGPPAARGVRLSSPTPLAPGGGVGDQGAFHRGAAPLQAAYDGVNSRGDQVAVASGAAPALAVPCPEAACAALAGAPRDSGPGPDGCIPGAAAAR